DGKFDSARHEAQALCVRPFTVTPDQAARYLEIRNLDGAVEQRTRNLRKIGERPLRTLRRDLPVPSRIDALKTRIAVTALQRQCALDRGLGGGDHFVKFGFQPRIEVAFDRSAKDAGERVAADEQAEKRPDRRG